MRLIDLGVVYLLVGAGCAAAVVLRAERAAAAGPRRSRVADLALAVLLWPLTVPVLLAAPAHPAGRRASAPGGAASERIAREHALLLAAIDAVGDPALAPLLPTREQLGRLAAHLTGLDGKVAELDEVLAREDFDPARADRAVRDAERHGSGPSLESARLVRESIARLASLRARAAHERDELLALSARLRAQVTVMRFAPQGPREDVGELVADILGRVEGVGAALEPGVQSHA